MENKVSEISASWVTIEVIDGNTGIKYRRELPIDYYETANCLRLRGEALDGSPTELVFYSDRGLDRLRDLTGRGPDTDACGHHA